MAEDRPAEDLRRQPAAPFSAAPGLRLGRGREFDLIREFYSSGPATGPSIRVGPGDDAAVLSLAGTVLSVDLSIEDIHFRREWLSPREIGHRAAAAALSDLAAMGSRVVGILVSIAVAPADAGRFASEVMEGASAAVTTLGGDLLGGDLSRSPGPLIIDIVAVGETEAPVTRGGARAGDELWVTGDLGGAAFVVEELSGGRTPDETVRLRFAEPIPRVQEALWLVERGLPRAMLDLSDGIVGDAGHLAQASGVAVVIAQGALPIHGVPASAAPEDALRLALSGGEDYELLFAARPGTVGEHRESFHEKFGTGLTLIGHCEEGEGVHMIDATGRRSAAIPGGFQHFGGTG